MYSSITCGITPGLARLPRGLALLLMLSLVLQAPPGAAPPDPPVWPPLACAPGRWQRLRRRRAGARPPFSFPGDSSLASYGLRLLVRELWLGVLLQTSGAGTLTPWSQSLLLLPFVHTVGTLWLVAHPRSQPHPRVLCGLGGLQRLYQLSVVLLLLASALQVLTHLPWGSGGLVLALGLGTGLVVREATPAIQITTTGQNRYQVDLRGTFSLLWEPRDAFERWLLILFLRRLHRPGQTRTALSQQAVGAALGLTQPEVRAWERQVRAHGRRPRAVWRYAYFAVDAYSYDLLAVELYPEHNDEAVRLFLLELKPKGIRPRVVVSDLDPAYGRMVPRVFPQAVHHECIFPAVQNALSQMTQVYGRYYLKIPETAPLHDAITQLFHPRRKRRCGNAMPTCWSGAPRLSHARLPLPASWTVWSVTFPNSSTRSSARTSRARTMRPSW